ncbi:hypothetical protein [Streptomyces sp. NBC_01314]|uniref:hypothetical protein n=1 Tax=Streptomyces sp. NBC_01314 TaxID=2903821 RepID=UPI003088061B|nr:hypothetical protein OG622_11055 [Streptomyces sp. NBC_01314]
MRVAEVAVAGVRIRADEGEGVIVSVQVAHRDPSAFAGPGAPDVRRDTTGHPAFGHGPHQGICRSLARAGARRRPAILGGSLVPSADIEAA